MDLKLSMEEIEKSSTFSNVMATVLAVGNHLNGAEVSNLRLAMFPAAKRTNNINIPTFLAECSN